MIPRNAVAQRKVLDALMAAYPQPKTLAELSAETGIFYHSVSRICIAFAEAGLVTRTFGRQNMRYITYCPEHNATVESPALTRLFDALKQQRKPRTIDDIAESANLSPSYAYHLVRELKSRGRIDTIRRKGHKTKRLYRLKTATP